MCGAFVKRTPPPLLFLPSSSRKAMADAHCAPFFFFLASFLGGGEIALNGQGSHFPPPRWGRLAVGHPIPPLSIFFYGFGGGEPFSSRARTVDGFSFLFPPAFFEGWMVVSSVHLVPLLFLFLPPPRTGPDASPGSLFFFFPFLTE